MQGAWPKRFFDYYVSVSELEALVWPAVSYAMYADDSALIHHKNLMGGLLVCQFHWENGCYRFNNVDA